MRIFVSYRREGASYQTGRLCDRLVARFGRDQVFYDTQSIPLGSDYREVIRREVERSDALLIVIGDGWLDARDSAGNLRLHQPDDFVRFEIATALGAGVAVIPLLFDRAAMPVAEQLPPDLRELTFRNGQRIQPDPNFHEDVDRLIEWLEKTAKGAATQAQNAGQSDVDFKTGATAAPRRFPARRIFLALLILLSVAGATGFGVWKWISRPDPIAELRRREVEHDVAMLTAQPPLLVREKPANYREVDAASLGDNAAINILSSRLTVDLRGWKDVPADRSAELVSGVTMYTRMEMVKTAPVDHYQDQFRTSGLDLYYKCLNFPFSVEALKGDSFVGTDRMKVRKTLVDISSIPVGQEFIMRDATTFWNSLQTEPEQWFGLLGYKRSFLVSFLIVFPTDKPFKSYTLMSSRTGKDTPTPYVGPRIVMTGPTNNWIFWEVPSPQEGYVYRVHWKW